MILPLIFEPNPILHSPTTPLPEITPGITQLIRDMIETMYAHDGVGLAAPQINQSCRLAVVWDPETKFVTPLINPSIIKHSFTTAVDQEGCLSIPGTYGDVRRYRHITLEYTDSKTKKQTTLKATGLFARIIQHEIDHLDGILFTDKAIGELIRRDTRKD